MEGQMEHLCREACKAKGINPDGDGYGMGHSMPEGSRYKLWEAQRATVEAILEGLNRYE